MHCTILTRRCIILTLFKSTVTVKDLLKNSHLEVRRCKRRYDLPQKRETANGFNNGGLIEDK